MLKILVIYSIDQSLQMFNACRVGSTDLPDYLIMSLLKSLRKQIQTLYILNNENTLLTQNPRIWIIYALFEFVCK